MAKNLKDSVLPYIAGTFATQVGAMFSN